MCVFINKHSIKIEEFYFIKFLFIIKEESHAESNTSLTFAEFLFDTKNSLNASIRYSSKKKKNKTNQLQLIYLEKKSWLIYLRSVSRAENGAGPAEFWSCLARDAVLLWGFSSYSFFSFSIVSK